MSPKNIKKLKELRKSLDKLDNLFINLIKKRTAIVKEVLKLKENKNQIVDKKRIKKILRNIKIKSQRRNLDARITNEIWKSMIRAYIKYEFRNFRK